MTNEANLNETLATIEKMTAQQAFCMFGAILTQKAEQINLSDDEIPAFVDYVLHNVVNA